MDETTNVMQSIARVVNRALNPDGDAPNGFVVLVFPKEGPDDARDAAYHISGLPAPSQGETGEPLGCNL